MEPSSVFGLENRNFCKVRTRQVLYTNLSDSKFYHFLLYVPRNGWLFQVYPNSMIETAFDLQIRYYLSIHMFDSYKLD